MPDNPDECTVYPKNVAQPRELFLSFFSKKRKGWRDKKGSAHLNHYKTYTCARPSINLPPFLKHTRPTTRLFTKRIEDWKLLHSILSGHGQRIWHESANANKEAETETQKPGQKERRRRFKRGFLRRHGTQQACCVNCTAGRARENSESVCNHVGSAVAFSDQV